MQTSAIVLHSVLKLIMLVVRTPFQCPGMSVFKALSFTHTEQWRQQLNRESVVEVTVMAMKRCSNSEWVQFTGIQALQNLCNTGLSVCLSVCLPVCLLQILSVCLSLLHNLAMFV